MIGLANSMYAAIESALVAAWPDITEVGENDTFEEFAWATFTPPFAAIIGSSAMSAPNSPTNSISFDMTLRLAYIGAVGSTANWATLRSKMDDLIGWFQANQLTFGQLMSIDAITWGKTLETNMVFIDKNYSQRMAVLDVTVRYGYLGGLS